MLLCATPTLSYWSPDWCISQKGRVRFQRQSLESAPMTPVWKLLLLLRVGWHTSVRFSRARLGMWVIYPRPDHRNAWVHGSFCDPLSRRRWLSAVWCVIWLRRFDMLLYCSVVVFVCVIITVCQGWKCAGCAVQLRVSMCVWLPRSADQLHCDAKAQKHTQTPRCVHVRDWVCQWSLP